MRWRCPTDRLDPSACSAASDSCAMSRPRRHGRRSAAREAQETGDREATGGLAEVADVRPGSAPTIAFRRMMASWCSASFSKVRRSSISRRHELGPSDAFVIPPGEAVDA